MGSETQTFASTDGNYQVWLESIRNRDSQSWDILIAYFADDLRTDIRKSLGKYSLPLSLVDDVSQETWLTAYRKIDTLVWIDEKHFYHWLRVVACNHVHRARRYTSREISIDDYADSDHDFSDFFETYNLVGKSVEDEVIELEQRTAIALALQTLKPIEQEIFTRWLMGETPRALAAHYQRPPHSISMIVFRAKQKVEASIQQLQTNRMRGNHHD